MKTSARPGSIEQRSQRVSATTQWSALASDGTSLFACTTSPWQAHAGTLTYYNLSLASGRQQIIASWPRLPSPQCGASLDPSGGYLLVQYPHAVTGASGWVIPAVLNLPSGELTKIAAPAYYGPLDIAW